MVLKLVRTDQDSTPVTLSLGIHEFGRGVFLDCEDKRVSRCHGKLEVREDNKIIVTALHKNPCFVTVNNEPGIIVMAKGMTRELLDGDEFGLLPSEYWYRIIKNEENDQGSKNEAIQKKSAICEKRTEENPDSLNIADFSSVCEPHTSTVVTELKLVKDSSSQRIKKRLQSPSVASSSSAKLRRLSSESLHIDDKNLLEINEDNEASFGQVKSESGNLRVGGVPVAVRGSKRSHANVKVHGARKARRDCEDQSIRGSICIRKAENPNAISTMASTSAGPSAPTPAGVIDLSTSRSNLLGQQTAILNDLDDSEDEIQVQTRFAGSDSETESEEDIVHLQRERDLEFDDVFIEARSRDAERAGLVVDEGEDLPTVVSGFQWSGDFSNFTGTKENFDSSSVGAVEPSTVAYDCFRQFWDDDILGDIVNNTNLYAQQSIAKLDTTNSLPSSRLRRYSNTCINEILVFLTMIIAQGTMFCRVEKDYWKKNWMLELPGYRKIMSYDRFILLKRCLHFVDNTTEAEFKANNPVQAPYFKLHTIIAHCQKTFQSLYQPGRALAIDESLFAWRGNLKWVQYIKSKAAKFGIKMYEICCSDTGYLLNFIVYTGSNTHVPPLLGLSEEVNTKTSGLVIRLVERYLNLGHTLYMDNFFNSPALTRWLKGNHTDVVGTLRPNRKNVPECLNTKMIDSLKGLLIARHCGDISVFSWFDKRRVSAISTYSKPDFDVVTNKRNVRVTKPKVIIDYNSGMGGVDRQDAVLANYTLERNKSTKWYTKLFRRYMNMSINNAFIICQASRRTAGVKLYITQEEFRRDLMQQILKKHHTPNTERRSTTKPCDDRLVGRHLVERRLERHEVTTEKRGKEYPARRWQCQYCSLLGKRKSTNFFCTTCNIALCVDDSNCFMKYHTDPVLPRRP